MTLTPLRSQATTDPLGRVGPAWYLCCKWPGSNKVETIRLLAQTDAQHVPTDEDVASHFAQGYWARTAALLGWHDAATVWAPGPWTAHECYLEWRKAQRKANRQAA